MKLRTSLIALGMACMATAASAQIKILVYSDQPIVIGLLVPPQSSIGLKPAGKVLNASLSYADVAPTVKKIRQPDVIIRNSIYTLNCFQKSADICERIANLLELHDGK